MAPQSLKRCPDCGEAYSASYKYCPFCEEEAAFQEGEMLRRSKRSRSKSSHSSSFSLVTPTLIILILLMASLLVYLLFGDQIKAKLKGEDLPDPPAASSSVIETPPVSSSIEPVQPDPSVSTEPPAPVDPPADPVAPTVPYETVYALPTALTLNKSDFTLPVGDPDVQLKVSGGSGTYTWVSQDPNIATVDETGKVKAVARGTVNVLVSDGIRKGVCIVRVKGGSAPAAATTPESSTPSTGLSLNKTDYTTKVGDMDVLLTLGVTDGVLWETSNAAVATVSKGLVHAVGKGNCTITATYEGHSYECIVRVKG